MPPRLTADLIMLLHFAFIAFVVLGGFLVLKWRKVAFLHIPCVLWGILVELTGWICPLTPLEFRLRNSAGNGGYDGSFVDHYIMPLIYPEGLTRTMQIQIGIAILVINVVLYTMAFLLRSKHRRSGAQVES